MLCMDGTPQVPANVDTDAFIQTLGEFGNALNLLNLGPCSGNTPHVHPRGAEISTIVRGALVFGCWFFSLHSS